MASGLKPARFGFPVFQYGRQVLYSFGHPDWLNVDQSGKRRSEWVCGKQAGQGSREPGKYDSKGAGWGGGR